MTQCQGFSCLNKSFWCHFWNPKASHLVSKKARFSLRSCVIPVKSYADVVNIYTRQLSISNWTTPQKYLGIAKREYRHAGKKDVFQATIPELTKSSRALWRLMVETSVHLRHLLWLWFHDSLALLHSIWKFLPIQYQDLVHVLVHFLVQKAGNSQHRSAMSHVGMKESLLIDYVG